MRIKTGPKSEILHDKKLKHPVFGQVSELSDKMDVKSYVVGGWVRDLLLGKPSKDIDIVVTGNGLELAKKVAQINAIDDKLTIFKNFGTAMLRIAGWEIEFVGARKESYRHSSRKPIVEQGTFEDDISRRDFTINSLAISLNKPDYGALIDLYDGKTDLKKGIIRTPLDPNITYSDDPLRMMRAIRFASRFQFHIACKSFEAIKNNAHRMKIVSIERIMDEFNKVMMLDCPSRGIKMMRSAGLLKIFFPELDHLSGVDIKEGKAHKDNFLHTLKVLDNVCKQSNNLWLRWAALLHDIAKPQTKQFNSQAGWSFHGHEFFGARMVPKIFKRLKLPLSEKMKYVQKLVLLHLRPIALSESIVTDSAIRRLLFEAGDDIDDLMTLCEADITSANEAKVKLYLENFENVRQKLKEIEEKDKIRNWQPPVTGNDIMTVFGLKPCREVGMIKTAIREAILDGELENNREEALKFMLEEGKKIGLTPVEHPN